MRPQTHLSQLNGLAIDLVDVASDGTRRRDQFSSRKVFALIWFLGQHRERVVRDAFGNGVLVARIRAEEPHGHDHFFVTRLGDTVEQP